MQATKYTESWFIKRFMLSMMLFLLTLAIQTLTIEFVALQKWQLVIVTLLPTLPLVWAFFIYKKRFDALDEYMRRLTSEAFLWVIGIVCFTSFAYGMLAMKLAMPEVSLAFVLPAVFGGHGLILQLLLRGDNSEE